MKLKLYCLAALSAGFLSSCVTEDLAGPEAFSPAEFSIRISSSPTESKATYGADIDYTYATKDELYVDRCVFAVFNIDENNEPSTLKMYAYATTTGQTLQPTTTSGAPNDTLAYEYTFKDLFESKEEVHILVIANIPEETVNSQVFGGSIPSDLSTIHYSDFMEMTISNQFPSTFDAKTLIKMGEARAKFDRHYHPLEIPMTQLAARVDFNVKVTIPPLFSDSGGAVSDMDMKDMSKWTKDLGSIHTRNDAISPWTKSYIVHYDDLGAAIDTIVVWHCKIDSDHDKLSITLNGKTYPYDSGWKFAYVDGMRVDSIKIKKQWVMLLNSVKVFNIQSESFLMDETTDQAFNTWIKTYADPVVITGNHVERFYTYRKSIDLELNHPIEVEINASLALVTITDWLRYRVSGHGLWVKKKETGSGKDELDTGWGMGDGTFIFLRDSKRPPVFSYGTRTTDYERIDPYKTYTTKISATGSQQLESGWLYDIIASVGSEYLPPDLPASQQPKDFTGGITPKPDVLSRAGTSVYKDGILFDYTSAPWVRK